MKHTNIRAIVLLVLCLAMIALSTSCGLKTWMEEKAPWVDKGDDTTTNTTTTAAKPDNTTTVGNENDEKPDVTTTTKPPKEEVTVPNVEYKDEMSDDDFIKGSWGDTSEN